MQQMTKQQMIMRGLSRIQSYFDVRKDDETLELYIEELSKYSEDELTVIFSRIVKKCKFFPRISEIDELLGSSEKMQELALISKSHEAFDKALAMMRKVGSYRTPEFDDPLIPAVIRNRFNGWSNFGQVEVNQWTRKAFVEEYENLSLLGIIPQVELKGIHQRKQLGSGVKQIEKCLGVDNEKNYHCKSNQENTSGEKNSF